MCSNDCFSCCVKLIDSDIINIAFTLTTDVPKMPWIPVSDHYTFEENWKIIKLGKENKRIEGKKGRTSQYNVRISPGHRTNKGFHCIARSFCPSPALRIHKCSTLYRSCKDVLVYTTGKSMRLHIYNPLEMGESFQSCQESSLNWRQPWKDRGDVSTTESNLCRQQTFFQCMVLH